MSLIKALMIPDASKTLSDKIESIVISANDSRQKAMELFSEAEKNFIQILSFDTFTDPKEVLISLEFRNRQLDCLTT